VDETGQLWQNAPARLKPEFEPYLRQPNEVLVFVAPLHLPPDIPLGRYTLEMGLRLKATGEETVRFPLASPANTLTVGQGAVTAAGTIAVPHRLDQPVGETGLTLLGYSDPIEPRAAPGAPPRLYLYWQVEKPVTEAYDLRLELLPGENQRAVSWRKTLAPELHPIVAWQPGEIVTLPFPLEAGQAVSLNTEQQFALSVLPANQPEAGPIVTVDLSLLSQDFTVLQPARQMQHRLEDVTFDTHLDLLGYDLAGQGSLTGSGTLLFTLYWLNRRPNQPVEAEVQVVAADGTALAHQLLPVPPPTNSLTWQSSSTFELRLNTLPAALVIRARPAGVETWYEVEQSGAAGDDKIVITDVLQKVTVIPD
jgi:hypothetical protein